MSKAIEAVKEKNFDYLNAAKTFGVPKTFERCVKGQNKYAIGNKKFLGSKMLTFTPELEKELATYLLCGDDAFWINLFKCSKSCLSAGSEE